MVNKAIAQSELTATIKFKTSAVCEMCKNTIERRLAFTKGVKSATLDTESVEKYVTITYNPQKTSVAKLKKSIAAAGYKADDVMPSTKAINKLADCCKPNNISH